MYVLGDRKGGVREELLLWVDIWWKAFKAQSAILRVRDMILNILVVWSGYQHFERLTATTSKSLTVRSVVLSLSSKAENESISLTDQPSALGGGDCSRNSCK